MAGIDNIVNEILQEAKENADAILEEGRAKAREIAEQAAKEQAQLSAAGKSGAERTAADLAERAKSQSALRKRQTVLAARQEIIDEVIDKAYTQLDTQPDEDYFAMILALLKKTVGSGDGEICFCEKDLKRLPETFAQQAGALAKEAGGTLKISSTPAKIPNGFILSYGGIEENCTLDAMFAEKREKLRDLVNEVLW